VIPPLTSISPGKSWQPNGTGRVNNQVGLDDCSIRLAKYASQNKSTNSGVTINSGYGTAFDGTIGEAVF